MKKRIIFNIKKLNIFSSIKIDKSLVLVLLILCSGIILSVFLKNNKCYNILNIYISRFTESRIDSAFIYIWFKSFLVNFIFLFYCFVFGSSIVGSVFIPLFIFFYGYMYGLISSYLYNVHGLTGVAFNGLIILVPTLLYSLILILAGRRSIIFSINLSSCLLPYKKNYNISEDFKFYCFKFLIYLLLITAISFIDTVLSYSFISYFKF